MNPETRRWVGVTTLSVSYGLVVVNWVDLARHYIPAYSLWLALLVAGPALAIGTYDGFGRTWRLGLWSILLVSLANDLGYFPVGDLVFGFRVDLPSWFFRQLGFEGWRPVSSFRGPGFRWPIASWEMGAMVWARLAALAWAVSSGFGRTADSPARAPSRDAATQ